MNLALTAFLIFIGWILGNITYWLIQRRKHFRLMKRYAAKPSDVFSTPQ